MVAEHILPILNLLFENRKASNLGEEDSFIDNLYKIEDISKNQFNQELFDKLCRVIYDDSLRPDLIHSIISLLEHNYAVNDYVKFFIKNTEIILENAPDWFIAMIGSLLHTSEVVAELVFTEVKSQNKYKILFPIFNKMHKEGVIESDIMDKFIQALRCAGSSAR